MRLLVRCPRCNRQTDVSGRAPGEPLACRCGAPLAVPAVSAGDAAVVRCSSCGAPCLEGSGACAYCGADFTIHDRDLSTICPTCLRSVPSRARFCSGCGGPIAPEETAREGTDRLCPACGKGRPLSSRALGDTGLSVLECGACAGLWLSDEAFRLLCERARVEKDVEPDAKLVADDRAATAPGASARSFYRPCPVCSARMNRKNFGRRSGVILDQCREHGTWFDATELSRALAWIRAGGETMAEDREREEERSVQSAARFRVEPKVPEDAWRTDQDSWSSEGGILPLLTRMLLGKVR